MFALVKMVLLLLTLSQQLTLFECLDWDTVFMESECGTSVSMLKSFQLESSTGLTYKNQLDCTYTVSAPTGEFTVANIKRFELEPSLSGSCTDYVDFHDGSSTSTAKLNSDLVCGSGSSIPSNFTSTGESMTLRFVTDNIGTYFGFSINFVAATSGICSSSQFECNTSLCIDSSLQCDGYDQCVDNSDEDNCDINSASSSVDVVMIVVITLVVVASVSVIAAFVAYRIHQRNKWKKFINMHIDDDDGMVTPASSYPITHLYYKGVKSHPRVYESNKDVMSVETSHKENMATSSKDIPV